MSDGKLDKENTVRQRLVDAAAEIFAEKGFSQTTIREICAMAGANVAAVNYYWGEKESLYKRVIEELIAERTRLYPFTAAMDESLSPEVRLREFVEMFLRRLLDTGRPAWIGKIMAREMTQPTGAIKVIFEEMIKPTFKVLASIVRAVCGDETPENRVKLAVVSIISQCVFYFNARNIMDYLKELLPGFDIKEVAEHITDFSLKGLRNG